LEVITELEVTFVSKKLYLKHENAVGFVNVDGVSYPTTTVIVDGGCSKRSYAHSFNSNAGVAVIISQLIQKRIYIGILHQIMQPM